MNRRPFVQLASVDEGFAALILGVAWSIGQALEALSDPSYTHRILSFYYVTGSCVKLSSDNFRKDRQQNLSLH